MGEVFKVFGLPLHPLVVHLAVVLLPVAAIAMIVLVCLPKARKPLALPTVIALVVGALAAVVAKLSGENLASHLGIPEPHQTWGNWVVASAVAAAVSAFAWLLLQRRPDSGLVANVLGAITALTGLTLLVVTLLAGHSGASAVWDSAVGDAPGSRSPGSTPSATTGPGPESSPPQQSTFTLADVATHASAATCWVAINDGVYDLTDWIDQHPGGPGHILDICGTDATAVFTSQHSGDQEPPERLAGFRVGDLVA